jgi:hypothetical protein
MGSVRGDVGMFIRENDWGGSTEEPDGRAGWARGLCDESVGDGIALMFDKSSSVGEADLDPVGSLD